MAATPRQGKSTPQRPPETPSSSHGDSPVEMTPFEASPEDATWKDRTPRNINADDAAERTDALLDEASDLSFPASDPIAVPSTTRIEKQVKPKTEEKKK